MSEANYFLGIETTCDETAAAVFDRSGTILASVVASQSAIHAPFGGVVPEVASREHMRQLLPVIDRTLAQASLKPSQLSAVVVAHTPGLVGAILVGLTAAKAFAATLRIPLIGINHVHAHLYACQMTRQESVFPSVGLVVSGGHTNLFWCESANQYQLIGCTIDDAAGEAFDKVSAILKLGYPGGPNIERAAKAGNSKAYQFPRSKIHEDNFDFSFSGLKTAVLYAVHGPNQKTSDRTLTEHEVADLSASFQQAVIDVIIAKCKRAIKHYRPKHMCVGGGVVANSALRSALLELGKKTRCDVVVPPMSMCTDNAAMAAIGISKFEAGQFDPLDLDAISGLIRYTS